MNEIFRCVRKGLAQGGQHPDLVFGFFASVSLASKSFHSPGGVWVEHGRHTSLDRAIAFIFQRGKGDENVIAVVDRLVVCPQNLVKERRVIGHRSPIDRDVSRERAPRRA